LSKLHKSGAANTRTIEHNVGMNIPKPVREAARIWKDAGFEVYLVGGAVRDSFCGKSPSDFDLASSATPAETAALFKRIAGTQVIPTGIRHGTVTLRYRGLTMEVTTFRTDGVYEDGRHPESVGEAATIEEDLARRDFTMNAIAVELPAGTRIVDPFGGTADIKRRLIRAVGEAAARFAEDGLRPLRALRFAAQTGFTVHEEILRAIPGAIPTTAKVSAERLRDEFDKTIMADNPLTALYYMEETGLLNYLLPELAACRGVEQKGYHTLDVLDHSLAALEYAARKDYSRAVRLAALFHDIGKRETAAKDELGIWTFYQHEQRSAEITAAIMGRLRYPNQITGEAVHLIREHMFHYDESWGDAAVRRFLIRAGAENLEGGNLDQLFRLRLCDSYAQARKEPDPQTLLPLRRRIERELAKKTALGLKDLAVTGRDLITAGISSPGKEMGIMLKRLLEAVIEDPALNTKETLLAIARKL
jgi:putative nucleotidyltransferase with HDIG domain